VERARLAALRSLAMTRTPGAPHSAAAAVAALAEGARLADPPTRQIALLALTEATRNVGEHQKVLDYFDQLRDISPDAYIAERIRALQHLDRYADAEALLAKIRKEAGDNLDRLLPSYLFAQAWQHHNLGEIDAAEAVARTLLRQAEATGNFAFVLNSRMILCGLDIYRGELADARDHLAPLRDAAERNDPIRTSRLLAVQAWLAAEQGDLRESMDIAAPLLAVADNGCYAWAWSPAWMRTFAGAAHRAGDLVTAERAAHIAMLGARRNPGIASMEGVSWQVRGYLDRDIAVLRQAVATLRRSPRRLLLADALRDLGDAQAAAGQDDGGHAALGEAYALYRETGATGRARSVGEQHPEIDLPRRARPRNQARALHGWDALTESEARVAELIIAGHTNRSAASVLGVSANTISTHLRSVFAKFNVRSRVQLANAIRDAASGPSDRDEPVPR
jgi:DNA-binding CsgD family transcriptional regulator